MKKFSKLMLACLLILGLAACADDNNSSSNNQPSYGDPTIIINDNHTAKIGGTAEKTITFTNPYTSSTNLNGSYNNYINNRDSKITIDKAKSTCGFGTNPDGTTSNYISHTLQAGESCTLVYNFAPTNLNTELFEIDVEYRADKKTICPTQDTVPTFEQTINMQRFEHWYIYNYAEDSNGNKSPEYMNVEIPADCTINAPGIDYSNFPSYSQTFQLPAKQGEYGFAIYGDTLETNDNNCSINGNTLTVNNNNGCSLTVKTTSNYVAPIEFVPRQEGNPHYNVTVDINYKYDYYILRPNISYNKFDIYYYATLIGEDNHFYAGFLSNNEKVTSYEITGTNADKFKVAGTKHYSCTVDDINKTISIPQGQEFCLWTVEIADKTESGTFTATLNATLSTGSTNTYNIDGDVDLLTIQDILQNYCKENTQSNQTYKLF